MKAYNKAAKGKVLDQFTAYMERPKETLKSGLRVAASLGSQEYVEELSSVENLHKMLVFNSVYRVK